MKGGFIIAGFLVLVFFAAVAGIVQIGMWVQRTFVDGPLKKRAMHHARGIYRKLEKRGFFKPATGPTDRGLVCLADEDLSEEITETCKDHYVLLCLMDYGLTVRSQKGTRFNSALCSSTQYICFNLGDV